MPLMRLLVEGKDDKLVLGKLVDYYFPSDVSNKIDIRDLHGIDELLSSIPVQVKASDITTLGIVVDADISVESRWKAVTNQLARAGYENIPKVPQSSGTLLSGGILTNVGIWIMPDNTLPGMLEDFLSFLVPSDDLLWEYAEECLSKITVKNYSKSLMHTWLAWQEEPGKPLGQAITMRYLDPDSEHSLRLASWIRLLLEGATLS